MSNQKSCKIGLIDADLLDSGTKFPNLALLKVAGFLHDNQIPFELIEDPNADSSQYEHIFLSRVFNYTRLPAIYLNVIGTKEECKFHIGGTGAYANEKSVHKFSQQREYDLSQLERDAFLCTLPNSTSSSRRYGIDMARQMPYYQLYDAYIEHHVARGAKREYYKDYAIASIGFLTRGCVRHCPFCVNKLERSVQPYSQLSWFLDNERDERGKLVRPVIYLLDDNFLAADKSIWQPALQELIDSGRPFQFRQGLDERMIAESPDGELMADMLARANYHGDYIFAFDNWKDRDIIERALKIWKRHCPKRDTKFYLFCGYQLTSPDDARFYKDIWELFHRIKLLMSYGCIGYIMRHEDYANHALSNLYVQIARWCNQPQFYKKMSFWEFVYRNQTLWEERMRPDLKRPPLQSFAEFEKDFGHGLYGKGADQIKMCLPLQTVVKTLDAFPEHKAELVEMFNYKMVNLLNPNLWQQ